MHASTFFLAAIAVAATAVSAADYTSETLPTTTASAVYATASVTTKDSYVVSGAADNKASILAGAAVAALFAAMY
ncbi:hypothetical protein HDU97_008050 [Phlyctochytrium planicorne]|nr:hypothetical protein HDU97_008050 [Phlyctochytrium planicorne]